MNIVINSNTVVVGALSENSSTGTMCIIPLDDKTLVTKIIAPDGEDGEIFGSSTAISRGHIVVGAYFDDNENGVGGGMLCHFTTKGTLYPK